MITNRAVLDLVYDGVNISERITPFVTGFSYTDHDGGKSDDLQVNVENRAGLWTGSWFPVKGSILKAGIRSSFDGREKVLACGVFAVDEISASGLPDIVVLKAVSSFISKSLKGEKKSRAWENISFKTLAKEIAESHNLGFFYNVDQEIDFIRVDQRDESDLALLNRICRDNDLHLKISGEKLIIFESKTLEQASPVFSIVRGTSLAGRYSFSSKTHDIFRGARISYFDPDTKTELKYEYTPPNPPAVGQILNINQRMESLAAAIAKAKSMLRSRNKQEITGSYDMAGDPGLLSGLTGTVSGHGVFDGKYIITEAAHTCDRTAGYRTKIKIRKVMEW